MLEEGVSAQPEPQTLQRNQVVRSDVAQVDVRSKLTEEPHLLGLFRCFPEDVFQRDVGQDAPNQLHMGASVGTVDANVAAFAGFCDDLEASGLQLVAHHPNPLGRTDEDAFFFGTHFGEHFVILAELVDELAFFVVGDDHGSVADFQAGDAQTVDEAEVVVEFVADVKRFKQGAAAVNIKSSFVVALDLGSDVGGDQGRAKTELQQVNQLATGFDEVLGLPEAQPFVHHHGQAIGAGACCAFRQMRNFEHYSGFKSFNPFDVARIIGKRR